jgi:hypothetical protein
MTGGAVDFDVVVVGGSPALLARATGMARAGLRVALFEEHAELGGSWRLFAPLGDGLRYDGFEHYIAGGPKCREVLGNCGLELVPRPIWLMFANGLTASERALVQEIFQPELPLEAPDNRPLFLPYTEGNFIQHLRRGNFDQVQIESLRDQMRTPRARELRREKDVNFYFRTNMHDLLGRLEAVAREKGVSVRTATRVDRVETSGKKVRLSGPFGTVTTSRVLLGKYFDGEILCEDALAPFAREPYQRLTLIFRVRSGAPQPFRYVKLMEWNNCNALQDLTLTDDRPGEATFGLHVHPIRLAGANPEHLSALLVQAGLMNPDSVLIAHQWLAHQFNGGLHRIAERLPELSQGRINALIFRNLGQDIGSNPHLWRGALVAD